MEIEILKGENDKPNKRDEKKRECVFELKDLARALDSVQEDGYKLLAIDDFDDKEKDQLVTVIATAKGSRKVIDELLSEKSDVSKDMHEEIDKRADSFLTGLEYKDDELDEE